MLVKSHNRKLNKKFFISGITGGAVVPKKMQKAAPCFQQVVTVTPFATPEDKFFDVTTDEHIRCIWITAYIEVIKTKSRETARMVADETLEDYMEKFSG